MHLVLLWTNMYIKLFFSIEPFMVYLYKALECSCMHLVLSWTNMYIKLFFSIEPFMVNLYKALEWG